MSRDVYVPKEAFLERKCPGGVFVLRLIKDVDTRTGEIKSERQKFIDDVFTDEGYKVPVHKLGAKTFADISFPHGMTDAEIGKMARLAKMMIATSNMLGYRAHGGILPYTENHIINILGLSQKRGRRFIDKMIDLGVMQKNKRIYMDIESEEFYINPAYFFAGRRISLNLFLLFREHLSEILPPSYRAEFLMSAGDMVASANVTLRM